MQPWQCSSPPNDFCCVLFIGEEQETLKISFVSMAGGLAPTPSVQCTS